MLAAGVARRIPFLATGAGSRAAIIPGRVCAPPPGLTQPP